MKRVLTDPDTAIRKDPDSQSVLPMPVGPYLTYRAFDHQMQEPPPAKSLGCHVAQSHDRQGAKRAGCSSLPSNLSTRKKFHEDGVAATQKVVDKTLRAAHELGCNLKKLFGASHCGFLVLDHAERLVTQNGRSMGPLLERKNLLAQLLLLPKALSFNLTVVVVSNSYLLKYTSKFSISCALGWCFVCANA